MGFRGIIDQRRLAPTPLPWGWQHTGGWGLDGVVLAHDYATQRGGAERVALKLAEAFPGSPMYTTLYEPSTTFPEFHDVDVRPGRLNRYSVLRQHHRAALPFLAGAVDEQRVDGKLLIASSTGWAHGYQGADQTVVYCHAPARWLYQTGRYMGSHRNPGMRGMARQAAASFALGGLKSRLREWDARSARRADLYLANSTVTRQAVAEVYGIEPEVVPPPPALTPGGPEREVPGIEPGYLLCVARLLPYKNVDVIVEAVNATPDTRLVVVGAGPDRERLLQLADSRVTLLGSVDDDQLRWLYRNAEALVAASFEDYGLTPLEAGGFGRPSVVLRNGGFLDTVKEGTNGIFFDELTPEAVANAIREARQCKWEEHVIADHVEQFSSERFVARMRAIAARVMGMPVSAAPLVPSQRQMAADLLPVGAPAA